MAMAMMVMAMMVIGMTAQALGPHSVGFGGVEYAVVKAVWNIIRRWSIMLACSVIN